VASSFKDVKTIHQTPVDRHDSYRDAWSATARNGASLHFHRGRSHASTAAGGVATDYPGRHDNRLPVEQTALCKDPFRLPGTRFAVPSQRNHEVPYLAYAPVFPGHCMRLPSSPGKTSNRFLNNHQIALIVPGRSIQCR